MVARRNTIRDAAEAAYHQVVAQARQLEFFARYGVPDTLDGRFELVCLHAFLFLHRLKPERPAATALGQRFFDTMFADFDRSLRELGTGDLSVGRQVKRMAQGFYGRIQAYEQGLDGDDSALAAALTRNLYGTAAPQAAQLAAMAAYVRRAVAGLADQPAPELVRGVVRFDPPGEPV